MNKKTVVYAATRNLYASVVPCMASALLNGGIDEVVLLIEDDVFPVQLPENVFSINVSGQPFFNKDGPNARKRWTWMVLMKAALSKLLPWCDRVLFLDCDTIVREDIGSLWDLNMDGFYFGAVPQYSDGRCGQFTQGEYYNTGVLLCNLQKLQDGKDNEIIARLNAHDYEFCEQDCIADLCCGSVLALPGRYNASDFTVKENAVCIEHFAAHPEWVQSEIFKQYKEEYDGILYARKTGNQRMDRAEL